MVAVAVYLVVSNWADLRLVAAEIGGPNVAASALLAVLGTAMISQVWRSYVLGVGVRAPRLDLAQVFFVTQLGKYLPGSVWPVVAQMEAGRRWGAGRSTMLVSSALMLAMLTATGLGVGIVLLPWSGGAGLRQYWWTVFFLIPLAGLLHPRVTPWLLDRALRLVGRPAAGVRLTGRAVLSAAVWSVAVWIVLGLHIYTLVAPLGATGPTSLAAAVGGMALAWAVGLIIIPAPAGAGVRDTVLVLSISASVGPTAALTVALASRLLLLCADLALAALSMAVARGARARTPRGRPARADAEGTSDRGTAESG